MRPIIYDAVVAGSGGSGLVAALAAADAGCSVLVVEAAPLLGGTTAISGGNVWIACNPLLTKCGSHDNRALALEYLQSVTLRKVDIHKLEAIVDRGEEFVEFVERASRVRFIAIDRPDYHPQLRGAVRARGLEMAPLEIRLPPQVLSQLRTSPSRAPITFLEGRQGIGAEIIAGRRAANVRTQGAGLVAGLVEACLAKGVEFKVSARAAELLMGGDKVTGLRIDTMRGPVDIHARRGVVLATGGFEWNSSMVNAFLPRPAPVPVTPPWARGDGILMALKAGSAVDNMTETWWTAAIAIPGESAEGQPMARNIVRELALPGSILVNCHGHRFVNEASSYNDLGKAFLRFDPEANEYPNRSAWLVFDSRFRKRYTVASIPPAAPSPEWFARADSLGALAAAACIDARGLDATVRRFNHFAADGVDLDFSRGSNEHDRFNGDPLGEANPCLAPIVEAPFFAVPICLGTNGTKGGLATSVRSEVLKYDGTPVAGLYACGDVASSPMGPGYPGTGGSLGPSMTLAYVAGRTIAA